MAYTTINKSSLFQNTALYTGNGADGHAITGVGFQPDLTIIKNRNSGAGFNVNWQDSVRGASKVIRSSNNAAEATITDSLISFDTDGFTLDDDVANGSFNSSGNTFVGWNFKAGTSFSNSAGANGASIASTGSINTTAGFSIIKYTGSGSNATIAHGLGVVPKMIIFKNTSSSVDWRVYHAALGNTNRLCLNDTSASNNDDSAFNDTSPTPLVFSVGGSSSTNAGTMIAYCFSDKTGYSKVGGSYTGNGSTNGTFVYTGFKPAFVMIKNTGASYNWIIQDNKRDTFNPLDRYLYPNTSGAEAESSTYNLDFYSNGFKPRNTRSETNDTNNVYIYMAFASAPLVGTNNVPCTAR